MGGVKLSGGERAIEGMREWLRGLWKRPDAIAIVNMY